VNWLTGVAGLTVSVFSQGLSGVEDWFFLLAVHSKVEAEIERTKAVNFGIPSPPFKPNLFRLAEERGLSHANAAV